MGAWSVERTDGAVRTSVPTEDGAVGSRRDATRCFPAASQVGRDATATRPSQLTPRPWPLPALPDSGLRTARGAPAATLRDR